MPFLAGVGDAEGATTKRSLKHRQETALRESFKRISSCYQKGLQKSSKDFCLLDPHTADFCLCLSKTVFEN